MNKTQILRHLSEITQQPFLVFANELEEKTDNTIEALKILDSEEEVTAGRIAELLDIKPSSVTQIIKKLEEAGSAIRIKSEKDSRVTYVNITEKGRESLEEHQAIGITLKDVLFDGFSEEDLVQLDRFLEIMLDNISSDEFETKLKEVFLNDARWERFGKMSPHFGRAREQMLEQMLSRHEFDPRGFEGRFGGGFDGWKKGRRK